eukprot:7153116-Prorocentrum_lima.AAC.1
MGRAKQLTSGLGKGHLELLQASGVLQHLCCPPHSVLTASEGVWPDDRSPSGAGHCHILTLIVL